MVYHIVNLDRWAVVERKNKVNKKYVVGELEAYRTVNNLQQNFTSNSSSWLATVVVISLEKIILLITWKDIRIRNFSYAGPSA